MANGIDEPIKGKGRNPNSLKNLKPYKPGHAVPPGAGRPKGSLSFKERAAKFLDLTQQVKMPGGGFQDQTLLDGAILSLIAQAHRGNVPALKELFERVFGKEVEKLELTGKDGQSLSIEHSARLSEARCRLRDALSGGPGNDGAGLIAQRLVLPDDSGAKP